MVNRTQISNLKKYIFSLVIQQGINAIKCYTCAVGSDGCGPSFKSTGSGVIPGSNSTATYCIVSIFFDVFEQHIDFDILFIENSIC